jgi:hypothetical protein
MLPVSVCPCLNAVPAASTNRLLLLMGLHARRVSGAVISNMSFETKSARGLWRPAFRLQASANQRISTLRSATSITRIAKQPARDGTLLQLGAFRVSFFSKLSTHGLRNVP